MERFGLDDARAWNDPVLSWVRSWDPLAWHARLAAVACAGLVLANVAFAPANLWSLWVMAAWAGLLAVHAVAVALAGRLDHEAAATMVPAAAAASVRPSRPTPSGSAPLFSARSPTVERPRTLPAAVAAVAAAERAPAERRDVAPSAAQSPSWVGAMASVGAPAPAPREDVAVSVMVLPRPGDHAAPARIAPGASNQQPALPARVVALWGGAGAQTPSSHGAWGHPIRPDFLPPPAAETSAASAD